MKTRIILMLLPLMLVSLSGCGNVGMDGPAKAELSDHQADLWELARKIEVGLAGPQEAYEAFHTKSLWLKDFQGDPKRKKLITPSFHREIM